MPTPQGGGSLLALRKYLNVASDDDFILLIAWLLGVLHSRGPYPILILRGEQGSAKSTTAQVLRSLVDPNGAPLRSPSRSEHDLMVAARNTWVIALDNLSLIPVWLSDALCRLSTGGGFSTRRLYSDEDEVVFDAKRPIILTSIEEVATRSDLLDRAIQIILPPIGENQRRDEASFRDEFYQDRPLILGALLDAVSCALRRHDAVRLSSTPRMADFERWVTAAEPALPWPSGGFHEAYARNRQGIHELALHASPVGLALLAHLNTARLWEGSTTELMNALVPYAAIDTDGRALPQGWPRNPQVMSNMLDLLAPNLRALGIQISRPGRSARKRWMRLEYLSGPSSLSSSSSSSSSDPATRPGIIDSPGGVEDAQRCPTAHPDAA